MSIVFPERFPTIEQMKSIIQRTVEKSWKVDIISDSIDKWLDNFCGKVFDSDDEKRLAMWLLCNFTYYSSTDINYLCRVLYSRFIHDFVKQEGITVANIKEALKTVFYSSIGSASESGGLMLYHFRQEANLPLNHFFYPTIEDSKIYQKQNTLVYIDDAAISGGTSKRNYYNSIKDKERKQIYYLTIIASQQAVLDLEEMGIKVIYCSLVDDRNKCFSESSMIYYQFKELRAPSKKMAEEYGKDIIEGTTSGPLGYDNGEYCFGYYYNTPNNALPIFWSDINWVPIFPRKEKIQNDKGFRFDAGRYI